MRFLLLETGGFFLLETGGKLILEPLTRERRVERIDAPNVNVQIIRIP